VTTQEGHNSYQQSEPAGDAGAYDPNASYSPATTYQDTGGGYDPGGAPAYTMAAPKRERSVSAGGAVKGIVLTLIMIGIILMLVSKVYAAGLIKLDYSDYDDPDDLEKKVENTQYYSTVMNAIAVALIPMGLLLAAIVMEDLGTHVRSGLAIAAGIIIGLTGFMPILT
jgi:hypothetical protein